MLKLITIFAIIVMNLMSFLNSVNAAEPSDIDLSTQNKNLNLNLSKTINRSPQSIDLSKEDYNQNEQREKQYRRPSDLMEAESYRKRERLLASNSETVKNEESSFSILILCFLTLMIPLGLFWTSKKS